MERYEFLGHIDRYVTIDDVKVGLSVYPRQKTWGGWYEQTHIIIDGYDVGKLDTKRRNKRTETGTTYFGGDGHWGIMGHSIAWVVRTYRDGLPNDDAAS